MPLTYNRNDGRVDLKPQAKQQRYVKLLVIGGVGVGLWFLFTIQPVPSSRTTKLENLAVTPTAEAPQPATPPPSPAVTSPASASSRQMDLTPPSTPQQQTSLVAKGASTQPQLTLPAQLQQLTNRVQALDSLVLLAQNSHLLTAKQVKEIPRLVRKIRYQGEAAVPAIRAFLQTKADFNFNNMPGSEMASQRTLRLALIDTLRQIGGKEANAALVEQLTNNKDAAELAALKQSLAQQLRKDAL